MLIVLNLDENLATIPGQTHRSKVRAVALDPLLQINIGTDRNWALSYWAKKKKNKQKTKKTNKQKQTNKRAKKKRNKKKQQQQQLIISSWRRVMIADTSGHKIYGRDEHTSLLNMSKYSTDIKQTNDRTSSSILFLFLSFHLIGYKTQSWVQQLYY